MTDLTILLARIERSYDAIPRGEGVRVESVGPFDLFVREDAGWPYYARPRLGAVAITPADVEAVLARQRELGVPQAIEWVLETTPALLPAAQPLLSVTQAPLMVLEPELLPPAVDGVVLLDPSSATFAEDCAVSIAVAQVGFGNAGTARGAAGTDERDAAVAPIASEMLDVVARDLRAGHKAEAVVHNPAAASSGYTCQEAPMRLPWSL